MGRRVREADGRIKPSMKPGRVKSWVRVDWFTLLFEIPRSELKLGEARSAFNGATRLILGH